MSSPSQSAVSTPNLLDCDTVLKLLQNLLPTSTTPAEATTTEATTTEASTSSRPSTTVLASEYEALAALSHAIMTAVGFRLVGLGEDDSLENERKTMDDMTKSNALPARWNASSESYSFRYTHSHSQLNYLIKCIRMAHKFVIHGTAVETSKICSLELQVKDFTSASYFPFSTATDQERDPLWNGFISRSRINDLVSQFKISIIQQLIPGLTKPGYQEESVPSTTTEGSTTSGTGTSRGRGRGEQPDYYPDNDPLRMPGVGGLPRPGYPRPPIFGDPFSAEDPGFGGMGGGPHNPFNIGRDDLDPFGGRLGGIGGGGSGGGFGGEFGGFGGGIGGSSGGGMIVGPNHPMFRRPPGGGNGGGGIYGGPQPLPRGSVPPGARFDPIGPFGGHGGAGNAPGAGTAHQDPHRQGQGQGQGPAGRGSGRGAPFSGEPDNDEAPPPGYMDMFM